MDLYEAKTEAFVVRVWVEEQGGRLSGAEWRGHITHIPDGERRYVRELNGISDFIATYLDRLGVKNDAGTG